MMQYHSKSPPLAGILKRRHTSSESSAVLDRAEVEARTFSRAVHETRVETPEPSPNLPDTKPCEWRSIVLFKYL